MEGFGIALLCMHLIFDGFFSAGNWWGYLIAGSISALAAAAMPCQLKHPFRRLVLSFVLVGSIWVGCEGYAHQSAQARLAQNHYATCPSANGKNSTAIALRNWLDTHAASVRYGGRHSDAIATSLVSKYIVTGEPISDAEALASDTGYYIRKAPPDRADPKYWGDTAFVATCGYQRSDLFSQAMVFDVHYALDRLGKPIVSRVEAASVFDSL